MVLSMSYLPISVSIFCVDLHVILSHEGARAATGLAVRVLQSFSGPSMFVLDFMMNRFHYTFPTWANVNCPGGGAIRTLDRRRTSPHNSWRGVLSMAALCDYLTLHITDTQVKELINALSKTLIRKPNLFVQGSDCGGLTPKRCGGFGAQFRNEPLLQASELLSKPDLRCSHLPRHLLEDLPLDLLQSRAEVQPRDRVAAGLGTQLRHKAALQRAQILAQPGLGFYHLLGEHGLDLLQTHLQTGLRYHTVHFKAHCLKTFIVL
mmetsp:Transcript_1096/g.3064  ORF Transcript_1096/g.3064 Transcript_1096/m.3064 type:complete len:263 (-) Transcript_1096:932-1720(-)